MHLTKNKINIAELLKNCPKGMELDCTLVNNPVTLEEVTIGFRYPIVIKLKSHDLMTLTEHGYYSYVEDAKCIIFPKGKTTWEGFVPPVDFKDGDIVVCGESRLSEYVSIFKSNKTDNAFYYHAMYPLYSQRKTFKEDDWALNINIRLATEEEKQILFQAIKDNGYKWNEETKTLEKLVNKNKFAIGDTITNGKLVGKIRSRDVDSYQLEDGTYVFFNEVHNWELAPKKFNINTLKPFDKVLVRDGAGLWRPNLFGKDMIVGYRYFTAEGSYKECIPYEGNEHLLGTNNDCDEYFKIWE